MILVGVPQDSKTAVKWYTLARTGRCWCPVPACFELCKWRRDLPRRSNSSKMVYLAAEQGDAGAQYNLGLMYAKGQGVLQNYIYALVVEHSRIKFNTWEQGRS